MNQQELYAELRRHIGNPDVDAVADRELQRYLVSGLNWLADELQFAVRTEPRAVALSADAGDYPLPPDCRQLVWAEWNNRRLEPASTQRWERDGTHYRQAASGNPTEYAVWGRTLVLYPPPSSAAITTSAFVALRYFAQPELNAGGVLDLGEADCHLAVLQAAVEWAALHAEQPDSAIRLEPLMALRDERLQAARTRAQVPTVDYEPDIRPWTRRRWG